MISFSKVEMTYEPYPIAYLSSFVDEQIYHEMVESWPVRELFDHKPKLGEKYSLSEVNNGKNYNRFVNQTPVWQRFHALVKSSAFIESTLEFLENQNINLDLGATKIVSKKSSRHPSLLSRIRRITELSARFEFSMMPPNGGSILPHTDHPNKLITMVVSIMQPGEWKPEWGGGTEICLPKNRSLIFNQQNRQLNFDEVDVIKQLPFVPNQCVLFIKTYNSWHQVSPLQADNDALMRKTLTINIERKV